MNRSLVYIILFISISINAQDWASLNRFQKDNAQVKLTEDANRVVFMGNSITEHWRKDFFANNTNLINRGISGQTTPQMLLRFRQDVIDLNPSAVVILAGINDIAQNTGPITVEMIFNNTISMTELARINNIKVILCSVLPANNFPWREEIKPALKVIKLNSLLKNYAGENGLTYVDYYSAMVDKENGLRKDLGDDGVHPNEKGYAIMETLILNSINKTLLPDPLEAGWNDKKVCEVLKEDKTKRILKCTFPANVGHEKHYHSPHFGYTLKGGTFRITDDKGTKEINVKDGTTWSKSETSVHQVLNIGNTTSSYLIIETKD